jgi:hypothetical protein
LSYSSNGRKVSTAAGLSAESLSSMRTQVFQRSTASSSTSLGRSSMARAKPASARSSHS